VLVILLQKVCVMLLNKLKVISYPIQSLQVSPLLPYSSSFLMFGVLHVILLEDIIIVLVSLMISASSHGSTCSNTNLKSSKNSESSKILLNDYLTRKILWFKLTGGEYQKLNAFF
jgi:hypothetical protein